MSKIGDTPIWLVAEKFGKEHRNVMQSIKQFISSAENPAVLNMFVENSYIASNGKENPMYVMNRDGFTLLAMGFTGQKALQFKLDYISAFNKMEQTINSGGYQNDFNEKGVK